ncbi:MAG: hypothetical protein HQL72_03010 [Magnetococcales bacterium]|nr:hypothetical protein [Magnetococcales bacterium]
MKTLVRKRIKTTVLAGAALIAASVMAPQQAKADATLAAILGGSALLGLIFHANQPMPSPSYQKASEMFSHPGYGTTVRYRQPHRMSSMPYYPNYAPVVYASVAPVAMQPSPYYQMAQPVNFQVTAPHGMYPQSVYHSSANMNYPAAAPVMQQPMQQPMQQTMHQPMQQMQQTMHQPVQAQQMSYSPYGMGMQQPQFGAVYPQF